jgi:WD40 repeat protein
VWINVLKILFIVPSFLLLFCCPLASHQEAQKPATGPVMQGTTTKTKPRTAESPADSSLRRPRSVYLGDVVRALSFSPDGHWLATANEYGTTITIWNALMGKRERELAGYSAEAPGNAQEQEEMSRTDFGKFLRTVAPTIDPYIVQTLAFSPEGSRLASVDREGKVKVWAFQDGTLVYTVNPQGGGAFLTYSADGKVWVRGVVPRGENSKLSFEIHDAATGELLRTIPTQWPALLALRVTSNDILASVCDDWGEEGGCLKESVHIWNLASGEVKKSYPVEEDANPLDSFSPDGRWMARIGDAGSKILNLSNGEVKCSFAPQYHPIIVVFSPDSRELAVTQNAGLKGSNYHREIIELRSTATCGVIGTLQAQGNSESSWGLSQVAFTADGKRLAAAPYTFESIDMKTGTITNERFVKIWDVTTGSDLLTLENQNHD